MQQKSWRQPPPLTVDVKKRYTATLNTTHGEIQVELAVADAPMTVNNFVFLAREGFYDGVPFHRVIRGFMVQTGDPTGSGSGGPGYRFQDEPIRGDYAPGTLAMANAGPNTNGSQFFIMHGDYRGRLPKKYTIFGKVIAGQDVVDRIASVPCGAGGSGEMSRPTEPVRIEQVTVVEE